MSTSDPTPSHAARPPDPVRRWVPGERLRVLPVLQPGHSRVPGFLQGRVGTVVRDWGDFRDPRAAARGEPDPPRVPVYLLVFDPSALWPDAPAWPGDRVLVDVYGPALSPE